MILFTIICIGVTTIPSILCSEPSVSTNVAYGKFSTDMEFAVNEKRQVMLVFPTKNKTWPFRVTTYKTNASLLDSPVLVVVQQQFQVLSWSVPLPANSSDNIGFPIVSRTLCDENITQFMNNTFKEEFTMILSSYSTENVSIFVRVEEVPMFYIGDNPTHVVVSPSEPQYFFYNVVNKTSETITISISSNDTTCFTASIQKRECPVLDLNKDVTYDSTYQTIDIKGAMRIRTANYRDGFFLVFVAKPDDHDCHEKHIFSPTDKLYKTRSSTSISFTISPGIFADDYTLATLGLFGILGAFLIFALSMVYLFSKRGNRQRDRNNEEDNVSLLQENNDEDNVANVNSPEQLIKVDLLSTKADANHRKSFNYLWHTMSVGVFYAIPVVQLVLTYQRVMNKSGDEDLCYYNFLCANPLWLFDDFNHVFSNIGYIVTGILFLGVVLHRHTTIPPNPNAEFGLPVHYGIFYAMGSALIFEGILSACYHICPNQSNFQFDTSFMYVMAVLCVIKLYQNRHADIAASAYTTFGVLGAIIFIAMVGILDDGHHKEILWSLVFLGHILLCSYLSFKIYYLGLVIDGFKEFWNTVKTGGLNRNTLTPKYKKRFIVPLVANLLNWSLLSTIFFLDFGTFLLVILMGNAILYSITYTFMKKIDGEPLCLAAIIYGFLAIVTWSFATVFFVNNGTSWKVSPAQSRHRNQECIFLNFYDTHDIWHLLSSCALYFTFMFLLCLDDNLIHKRRNQLNVF